MADVAGQTTKALRSRECGRRILSLRLLGATFVFKTRLSAPTSMRIGAAPPREYHGSRGAGNVFA